MTLYALQDGQWIRFYVEHSIGIYLLWAGCNVVRAMPLGWAS